MEEELFDYKKQLSTEIPNTLFIRLCYLSILANIPVDLLIEYAINEFVTMAENNPQLTKKDLPA